LKRGTGNERRSCESKKIVHVDANVQVREKDHEPRGKDLGTIAVAESSVPFLFVFKASGF
jgi:hypothetical protein